ncbi:MAG TPA: hypothetical protein GXX38_03930 [Clostridia bacterium]|nr:hypothetical protein [Clostridia bacterium]
MDDDIKILVKIMEDNYRKQLEYYEEIFDLAQQERKLFDNFNWEELLEIMEKKQETMKKVDELNRELVPVKSRLIQLLGIKEFVLSKLKVSFPEQEYASLLETIIGKLAQTLEKLTNLEQENEKKLRIQIKQSAYVRKKEAIKKSYSLPSLKIGSNFIDKKK